MRRPQHMLNTTVSDVVLATVFPTAQRWADVVAIAE